MGVSLDTFTWERPPSAESIKIASALTLVVASLATLGVVLVYSSTSVGIALKAQDATLYLRKQLLWVALAAGAFTLARTTSLEGLRRAALPLWLVSLVLLLAVFIPGVGTGKTGGAQRWIQLGGLRGQPSEVAKLALILYLSAWESGRGPALRTLRGVFPGLAALGVTAGLVAVEPDMGTTLLLLGVGVSILVAAGARMGHLLLVGVPALLALIAFAFTRLDYIRRRIGSFLDPEMDPSGVGYQTQQALIAMGSGGPWGVGLGASQQKLLFLPDVHTDFIFSLVGEELGFAGGLGVLLAFCCLVVLGIRAVDRAEDSFALLLGLGIVLSLGVQAALNMSVATASVPPKGIALPFVSYGGSSLLLAATAAGILTRVAADGREPCALLEEESL